MVGTIKEIRTTVIDILKAQSNYLDVHEDYISLGLVGENADDVFTVDSKFIRVYTKPKDPENFTENNPDLQHKAALTIFCGYYDTDGETASIESLELAERVEKVLLKNNIPREPIAIFTYKNDGGISINVVPFWFAYISSAAEVPDE